MTKFATGGDPAWAGVFNNIAGWYDPKVEAEGAALRAKRASLESDARYNNARAAGVEDQNSALGEAYLKANGYTDGEIAAIRAARPSSVYDIAHGQNAFRGRTALEAGKYSTALPLLGQATALDDFNKGVAYDALVRNPGGTYDRDILAALAGGSAERGGNLVQLGADGKWTLGPVTAEGKARVDLLGTQGSNDTLRTTSQNAVDEARRYAIATTGDATADLRTAQANAVSSEAASKATERTRFTDQQIEYLRSKGVNLDKLTGARVETETAKQGAITQGADDKSTLTGAKVGTESAKQGAISQGANDKTRETDARITRINGQINNDALKATAEAANGTDLIKKANAEGQLRDTISQFYGKEFSENLGKPGVWEQLDPVQKRALTERTLEYVKKGFDLGTAMKKSEVDHNLTGGTVKGQKSTLFGLKQTPDGKITLEGFKMPSALADTVTDAATPGTPATPAPTMAPAAAKPAAPAAAADPVRITNDEAGREAFARLPAGTAFIDPNGQRRIKQ
jgi:hypothetical protein